MKLIKIIIFLIMTVVPASFMPVAYAVTTAEPTPNVKINNDTKHDTKNDKDRALFLKAEALLQKGQMAQYQKLKSSLSRYSLYPYLLFAEYEANIQNLSYDAVAHFLQDYSDSPLAEQLRTKWLLAKAKQEKWSDFLKGYKPSENTALQCSYIMAKLNTHPSKNEILKDVTPLWLKGKTPPKTCEPLFSAFEKSSLLTRANTWKRIKSAVEEGNESVARNTAKHLNRSELALVELWLMIHNNPYLVTEQKYFSQKHPSYAEMIVHGVELIAKTKPEMAIQIWQQINKKYPFSERHWGLVVRAIGLAFALQKNHEAEKWLTKVPEKEANRLVHEWRVRIALAREDWRTVLERLDKMPKEYANEEEWLYFRARALEMLGHRNDAQLILHPLSETRSFYGFLASHQLQKPYALTHNKTPIATTELASIAHKKFIKRAKELYAMGRVAKARSEWLTGTKQMEDAEKRIAAALALQWNLPNWAIIALANAKDKSDLSLRFPLVYSNHIVKEAEKHEIDPAFIFALTRQESAFIANAKSTKGAMGLMQILPTTAKSIIKNKEVSLHPHTVLYDPGLNIRLGTRYFRMMLNDHKNNHVLAAAAYNAGPGRVKKWLPAYDMAADIWIETIPFKQTREYVKNILTYTVIYQELLGKKPKLNAYMPYVQAKNANAL